MTSIIHQLFHNGAVVIRMIIQPLLYRTDKITLRGTAVAHLRLESMGWNDAMQIVNCGELLHAEILQLMSELMLVLCLGAADP